jgi:LytS/YehU family sensor histidine kinase
MPDPGERYDTAMWHSIIHPNDIFKDIKLSDEIKNGLSRSETDLRLKIDGGKDYRWYHFIAEAICDPSGKPEKMLGTLSDIEATYNQISELRRQIEHDQTEVLLTQISSHFFYHTLNAIQALIVLEPECASKMINDFSRYLRYRIDSVGVDKGLVTLREEMRSVTAYADINVVQLGDRLKVQYELEAEDFEIPVLTVQPIVENAIIHGIKPKAEGGTVSIKAIEKADCYQVTVEDDGVGFIPDEARKHTSVGMHNILTRLGRYKDCSMTIVSKKGEGTAVTLSFPKTMEVIG